MDDLRQEHELYVKHDGLTKVIDDVQATIDLLTSARDSIATNPGKAPLTLAKLKGTIDKSFQKTTGDLKDTFGAYNKYSRALDRTLKKVPNPTASSDAISSQTPLINRAIAMHLLREGKFNVASTFIAETNAHSTSATTPDAYIQQNLEADLAKGTLKSESLQKDFTQMYNILHEIRANKNLSPAIEWARRHRETLEHKGSNLEFELCRLQFLCYYAGAPQDTEMGVDVDMDSGTSGLPMRAWAYARSEFGPFLTRYSREIQELMGSLAYYPNPADSPYRRLFMIDSAWEEVAHSFTKEFCSMLGLSADSPLYIAVTAGAIALPNLMKLSSIKKEKKVEWTTEHELPVEIKLPPTFRFHSIFVCPVSKEQTTDQNPPMMMPCGHVIAKESLERISKSARFKCPYCPGESHPKEAKKVFF